MIHNSTVWSCLLLVNSELAPDAFHRRFWLEAARSLTAQAASSALHRSALLELVHQKPALVAELLAPRQRSRLQSSAAAPTPSPSLGSAGLHCFAAPHLPPHLGVGFDSAAHAHASSVTRAIAQTQSESSSANGASANSTRKRPALALLELEDPRAKQQPSGPRNSFTSKTFREFNSSKTLSVLYSTPGI